MNARQSGFVNVSRKRTFSMKCCLSLFTLGLVAVSVQAAGGEGVFSARSDGPLQFLWRGETLISSDGIDLLGEDGFAKPTGYRAETNHGVIVRNIWTSPDEPGKRTPLQVSRKITAQLP